MYFAAATGATPPGRFNLGLIAMSAPLSDSVHLWHDFYVLLGTASATLVGLTFVAATIGANLFTEANRAAMRAFLSPTVMHFTAVLLTCMVMIIPARNWSTLAFLLALGALAGLIHLARVWVQLVVRRAFKVDIVDRLFYGLIPVIGHVLVLAAAALLFMERALGLVLLAAALMTLLVVGIRNAWDMTMFIVIRTPAIGQTNENTPPPPRPISGSTK